MSTDIRRVRDMNGLIAYFAETLNWRIDLDDFDDIEDIAYDFDAEDIGLKEEAFAKIKSLRQLPPLVDGQKWGIFCVEFDSRRFEVTALRKILSGLIPKRRNSADHAVWSQQDLLFLCFWGSDNDRTIGIAHFEDIDSGLPQIKMISCAPAVEDFTQIRTFEDRLKSLKWPLNYVDHERWQAEWSSAFTTAYKQTIRDASTLTVQLALEAQGIRNRILEILEVESLNGYVHLLFEKFRNTLIHDMTETQFADMYAQTVVYGLFSARCMDRTQDSFNAAEAVDCIPNTNPFLKSLMKECLGKESRSLLSFDELEIGNVVELLKHANTDAIIADFNRQTGGGREDPVIHFYEEFLTAYDKLQKVQRGVYYTPQPVVNFIVRAVDTIIKRDFGLEDGLASTATKTIKVMRQSKRKVNNLRTQVEDTEEVPAIQVLDPATGTGTFIRQTILQIYDIFKKKNSGLAAADLKRAWNEYVPEHLLPRINAFELMMAPYAVTHMKLAMVLRDTGYDFRSGQRLNAYLTNTLEEAGSSDCQLTLWSDPLASESIAANGVKKNSGLGIVIGNPPYSSSSSNRGEWIQNLVAEYKQGLHERKINLDDDYIKFIRFGEYIVDRSGKGILAYISNNSFLDGLTHRVMRKHLMDTFDTIYIINLHGNAKKKEQTEDGGKDENVFDIQQGVSINIFVKSKTRKSSCKVFSYDLRGLREIKYQLLNRASILALGFQEITPEAPNYFFVPKDFSLQNEFQEGVEVEKLFPLYNSGIQTKCDNIAVAFDSNTLATNLEFFRTHSPEEIEEHFNRKSNSGWSAEKAKADVLTNKNIQIIPYLYRPFDVRHVIYSSSSSGIIGRPRASVMDQMCFENISLITVHFQTTFAFQHAFVTQYASDLNSISMQTGEQSFVFPLYKYHEEFGQLRRDANIDVELVSKLLSNTSLSFGEKGAGEREIFAYVYAILYCPTYRRRYKELLKIGFPRIPLPKSTEKFTLLSKLGEKLISLHTTRCAADDVECYRPVIIDSSVQKYCYRDERLYLNGSSYIENIPEHIWNMYIGGYQPIQKWLKERKGRALTDEDLLSLRSMIFALQATENVMKEIDSVFNK